MSYYRGKSLFDHLKDFFNEDWPGRLAMLKIDDSVITSWQAFGGAFKATADAINAVASAWKNLTGGKYPWGGESNLHVSWDARLNAGPVQGAEPPPAGFYPQPESYYQAHASGLDTVLTRATYLGELGIAGEAGPERLTITPLGKSRGGGTTQINHFHFYGLGGMTLARAQRQARLARLWRGM